MGVYWLIVGFACTDIVMQDLPPPSAAQNLLMIIHGSGDNAEDWPEEMNTAMTRSLPNTDTWDIWTYDWEEYAESKLSASKSGYELGEQIAYRLLEDPYAYDHVHLIAHSVGCFVSYGIAEHLFRQESTITVHSTHLDPFTGHGMVRWQFGERNFGQYSDFSESYYNKDDSVPSTNGALQFAHNFDVTALRDTSYVEDDFHWWPIEYYIRSIEDETMLGYAHSDQFLVEGAQAMQEWYPRGEETVLQ